MLLLLLLDLCLQLQQTTICKGLIWLRERLKATECPLHAEVGRILLAENILNLRLVIIAVVDYLDRHSLAPVRDELKCLLANLFYLGQVEVVA